MWVATRRRARVQQVDPQTARLVRLLRVGDSHGEDIAYSRGALWVARPDDDTVYKVAPRSAAVIPISVGRRPRRLAIADGLVYVTGYNSSDLHVIDQRTSRLVGAPLSLPVNPFSVAVGGGAVWVSSQPENKLNRVLTGRAG